MVCSRFPKPNITLTNCFIKKGAFAPFFLSMYNMSRQFKKLSLQYSYLKMEVKDIKDICISVEEEIRSYMENNYPEHYKGFFADDSKVLKKEPTENETNESKIKNKDLKKLYRKIASKIHPDKTSDEKESELFTQAAKAYSENDVGKILEIAALIDVDVLELSSDTISLLQNNINKVYKEIETRKKSSAWFWHHANTEEEKLTIIKHILKSKGILI